MVELISANTEKNTKPAAQSEVHITDTCFVDRSTLQGHTYYYALECNENIQVTTDYIPAKMLKEIDLQAGKVGVPKSHKTSRRRTRSKIYGSMPMVCMGVIHDRQGLHHAYARYTDTSQLPDQDHRYMLTICCYHSHHGKHSCIFLANTCMTPMRNCHDALLYCMLIYHTNYIFLHHIMK